MVMLVVGGGEIPSWKYDTTLVDLVAKKSKYNLEF